MGDPRGTGILSHTNPDPKALFIYLLPLGEVGSNGLLDPLKVHTKEALDIWALVNGHAGVLRSSPGTQCFLSAPKCTYSVQVDPDSFNTVNVERKDSQKAMQNVVI
jgi:hypothetical protein